MPIIMDYNIPHLTASSFHSHRIEDIHLTLPSAKHWIYHPISHSSHQNHTYIFAHWARHSIFIKITHATLNPLKIAQFCFPTNFSSIDVTVRIQRSHQSQFYCLNLNILPLCEFLRTKNWANHFKGLSKTSKKSKIPCPRARIWPI